MSKKKKLDSIESWSHKNDYPIEEVWNTENTLAQLIVPRLQAYKALDKHGCPPPFKDMREWNNTIQKMIDAFELMKYAHSIQSAEEQETVNHGIELFCKYFQNLWD
jgi:hypothetical protein